MSQIFKFYYLIISLFEFKANLSIFPIITLKNEREFIFQFNIDKLYKILFFIKFFLHSIIMIHFIIKFLKNF